MSRVARAALVAFALGLVVRVAIAAQGRELLPDGAIELDLARAITEGRWTDAVLLRFHPLLGSIVAGVATLLGRAPDETVAMAVVVAAGSVVPPLVAVLAARLSAAARDDVPGADERTDARDAVAALAAGVLAAAHPYLARASATIYDHPLAHAALAGAVLAATTSVVRARARWSLVAGVLAGAGYLARPDGLVLLAGVTAGAAAGRRRLVAVPLVLVGFALVASPYVALIHRATGEWRLTLKKDERHLAGLGGASSAPVASSDDLEEAIAASERATLTEPPAERPTSHVAALGVALEKTAQAGHPLVLALAVAGLVLARRARAAHVPALTTPKAFVLAHAQLKLQAGYLSRHHAAVAGVILCAWAGLALARVRAGRGRRVLVAGCVAILLAKAVVAKSHTNSAPPRARLASRFQVACRTAEPPTRASARGVTLARAPQPSTYVNQLSNSGTSPCTTWR